MHVCIHTYIHCTVRYNNNTPLGTSGINTEQHFTNFEGYARYWRLIIVDNHGGPNIGIREIYLDGYDERVNVVPFDLDNSNTYQMYYIPISTYLSGISI